MAANKYAISLRRPPRDADSKEKIDWFNPAPKRGELVSSFIAKRGRNRKSGAEVQSQLGIRPDRECPNLVNNERCWTVIAPKALYEQLSVRVGTLLKSQIDELYKYESRVLSTYFELYLVGEKSSDAQPTIIISCTSRDDYKRVKGLLKKNTTLAGFPSVNIATTIGSPRSSRPLEPLSGQNGEMSSTVQDLNSPKPKASVVHVGCRVYATSSQVRRGDVPLPMTIWLQRSDRRMHQAVLGGLITTGAERTSYGLTVAHDFDYHTSNSHSTETAMVNSPGNVRNPIEHKRDASGFPPQTRALGTARQRGKALIGSTISKSSDSTDHDLDWALVKLDEGYHFSDTLALNVHEASIPDSPVAINLLRPKGITTGTLSASPTYIRAQSGADFVQAWAITLDEPIQRGDCGSWVLDRSNSSMYGHVAYGHAGDTVAYILSAKSLVEQITRDCGGPVKLSAILPTIWHSRLLREQAGERYKPTEIPVRRRRSVEFSDTEVTEDRRRPKSRRSFKRFLNRLRRKEIQKSSDWKDIFTAAGTCFFLSILLSILISVHFALAIYTRFATNQKRMDQMRAVMIDTILQCFQVIIRETLISDDRDSLNYYIDEQMKGFNRIRRSLEMKRTRRSPMANRNLVPIRAGAERINDASKSENKMQRWWNRIRGKKVAESEMEDFVPAPPDMKHDLRETKVYDDITPLRIRRHTTDDDDLSIYDGDRSDDYSRSRPRTRSRSRGRSQSRSRSRHGALRKSLLDAAKVALLGLATKSDKRHRKPRLYSSSESRSRSRDRSPNRQRHQPGRPQIIRRRDVRKSSYDGESDTNSPMEDIYVRDDVHRVEEIPTDDGSQLAEQGQRGSQVDKEVDDRDRNYPETSYFPPPPGAPN